MALLYLEQEDAFWCLVAIVEVFMPRDYYTKTLLGSQVRTTSCGRQRLAAEYPISGLRGASWPSRAEGRPKGRGQALSAPGPIGGLLFMRTPAQPPVPQARPPGG